MAKYLNSEHIFRQPENATILIQLFSPFFQAFESFFSVGNVYLKIYQSLAHFAIFNTMCVHTQIQNSAFMEVRFDVTGLLHSKLLTSK